MTCEDAGPSTSGGIQGFTEKHVLASLGKGTMDNIQIETYNTCLVIKIAIDELDMKNTPVISKNIDQKLSELNYPSVIIDLNNISYIDSMGISFLVMLDRSLSARGKRLAIFCTNHSINQVFHVIQMEKFLKLFTKLGDSSDFIRKPKDNVIDMNRNA